METIRKFYRKHRNILSYLFFGVLTTAVNWIVYFPLYNYLHITGASSNAIAWFAAVIFAYLTNKPFVFKSCDWSMKTVLPEFGKFISCRVGSGVLETGCIWLFVDMLQWNGNLIKVITAILVVILNYVASKLLVFRKR